MVDKSNDTMYPPNAGYVIYVIIVYLGFLEWAKWSALSINIPLQVAGCACSKVASQDLLKSAYICLCIDPAGHLFRSRCASWAKNVSIFPIRARVWGAHYICQQSLLWESEDTSSLFRAEPWPSSWFMNFCDQRYLGLCLLEIHRFRSPTYVIRCESQSITRWISRA